MALETDRTPAAVGSWGGAARVLKALKSHFARLQSLVGRGAAAIARTPPVRIVSQSLLRRILVANLLGLSLMIGGILYQSQYHAWLIDAKRESLKVQGQMIAAAIASEARVEKGSIRLNPEKLPNSDETRVPRRDDGFAALELSIRPERVGPILRRLGQPSHNRARIYDRDGNLIVDSSTWIRRGQLKRLAAAPTPAPPRESTKNVWTRLMAWLIDKDLPVYKEIGSGNGLSYPEVRAALGGSATPMLLLTDDGEEIVSMAVPIKQMNSVLGALLLSTRPGDIDAILAEERAFIWTVAAIALAATIATSILLARTVSRPMRRLSAAAQHVSRDINARHDLPDYSERNDEVGQMATAFRDMTASLYRRIEGSERFAADVAHELKNPLAAARSTAESLAYAKTPEQRAELVAQIQHELKRLNRLIIDVSNASRLDAELARQRTRSIDVTTVIANVAALFRDGASGNRRVRTLIDSPPFDGAFVVNGEEGRLGQILTNLVDNALSFSPGGGTVTLGLRHVAGSVEISVTDEGPGIPEDRLEIIFERFYSDRPSTDNTQGKNSGLGLSISREIARAHGGDIRAENLRPVVGKAEPGTPGARFVVSLPAVFTGQRGGTTSGRRS